MVNAVIQITLDAAPDRAHPICYEGPVTVMSGDAADKLAACLNWASSSEENATQDYFDACARWFALLSPDDTDAVRTIIDVMASAHKNAAKGMAATLPPAPKCPL